MIPSRPSDAREPRRGFISDNMAGASPEVIEALAACNQGLSEPYGADGQTRRAERKLRDIFECEASVFFVPTGTAANALCLSALTPPWGKIFCHPQSHVHNDECGAPEFYTGGAKVITVHGHDAKIDPAELSRLANFRVADVHSAQPACASITQATETGSVYTPDQVRHIGDICRAAGIRLHMDGSRFANALVSLGCTPAQATWKAGVDALSFGATKNGALGAEAVILFDPRLAETMGYLHKRGGHLLSKMRFLSAQIDAYLQGDLWLRNASQANAMARRLEAGLRSLPGVEPLGSSATNILFCKLPQAAIDGLEAEGFSFYRDRWGPGIVRFVTCFDTSAHDVDHLVSRIKQLTE